MAIHTFTSNITLPSASVGFTPSYPAETYSSVLEAEKFLASEGRTWSGTDTEKLAWLVRATRAIDRLFFRGEKTDESQVLEFPRDSESTIPIAIKRATALLAAAFSDGIDPELERAGLQTTSTKYASIGISFDRSTPQEHIALGIPSFEAWQYIKPWVRDFTTFRRDRVS